MCTTSRVPASFRNPDVVVGHGADNSVDRVPNRRRSKPAGRLQVFLVVRVIVPVMAPQFIPFVKTILPPCDSEIPYRGRERLPTRQNVRCSVRTQLAEHRLHVRERGALRDPTFGGSANLSRPDMDLTINAEDGFHKWNNWGAITGTRRRATRKLGVGRWF